MSTIQESLLPLRSKIRHVIASISPLDSIENEHLCFTLDWIDSGAEIFRIEKPATPPIHLVSYFVVASPDLKQILLVDHKKAELWLPSGGHVEMDEHPKDTVCREVKEELGIEADFLYDQPLLLTKTTTVGNVTQHTDISLWYLIKGDPLQTLDFDRDEFHQIQWFPLDQIPFDRTDPHMRRFVQKMQSLDF